MKILHFHLDGRMAIQFIEPLVEAECGTGYESRLVVARKPQVGQEWICFEISPRNLLRLPFALFKLMWLIKNFAPRLVVSHNTTASFLPLLAAWLMRVRTRIYFNHGVPYIGYVGLTRWGLRFFERWNCHMATHVLTVSQDMCRLLIEVVPNVQPKIILNGSACGLDLSLYSPERFLDKSWRKKNRFDEGDVVIVFIGRPERRKGFEHVLHLWRDYLKEPKFKLVLCGAQIEDVLKFIPVLPSNVLCLGFVSNIPEILSNADFLILPSLHEGLSYATLEAMACGAIAIVNDIPGIRCLIQHGVSGYLVQHNSLEKYAELFRLVANDPVSMAKVREQARFKVLEFSREHFLPAYLVFIKQTTR